LAQGHFAQSQLFCIVFWEVSHCGVFVVVSLVAQ